MNDRDWEAVKQKKTIIRKNLFLEIAIFFENQAKAQYLLDKDHINT